MLLLCLIFFVGNCYWWEGIFFVVVGLVYEVGVGVGEID